MSKKDLLNAEIQQFVTILEGAVKGEVSERLVQFNPDSPLAQMVTPLNNLLDRVECVLREQAAVSQAINNKDFYRTFLSDGLGGAFLQAAEASNTNLMAAAEAERGKVVLAQTFEAEVGSHSENIGVKVNSLLEMNTQLEANMSSMAEQVKRGEERGRETTFRVQSVATAAEELSSSISEISLQTERTNESAGEAIGKLAHALDTVKDIDNSAEDVSGIVSIINDVARQTNLLALNAAIEAARAGEAGRGFGVVASEVKELANQTRRATRDIIEKIENMKGATSAGLQAMQGVEDSLNSITELFGAIGTAIQEQSSVTQEIAKNAEESAVSVGGLQDDLSRIAERTMLSEESVRVGTTQIGDLNDLAMLLDVTSKDFVKQILS
jgi:methyl-accepting chemotaxis protein